MRFRRKDEKDQFIISWNISESKIKNYKNQQEETIVYSIVSKN